MENTTEYIITHYECAENIERLGDVCCAQCGSKIVPVETVDNSDRPTHWAGCVTCQIFTGGIPVRAYQVAEKMIERNNGHNPICGNDSGARLKGKLGEVVAKALTINEEIN